MPLLSLLERSVRPLMHFVYPPTCFVCDNLMNDGLSRVCPDCWSTIWSLGSDDPLYSEMQRRLMQGDAMSPGTHGLRTAGSVSRLVSLYRFEKGGTLQSMIHQLKYEGMTGLGVELGRKLGESLRAHKPDVVADLIIPVPLHRAKLRERGYNQSERIAWGIHKVTGVPVSTSVLKRHKDTASQTHLTASERMANVGDAFSGDAQHLTSLRGKTILLVDDVITTGATIEACAAALKRGGVCSVIAGSIAIADHSA